jgi:hypothetical protein
LLSSGSNCIRSEHKSQHCKRIALREYHPVRPPLHHSSFFAQQKYITNLKNNFMYTNSSNRHDRDQDDAVVTIFGQKIYAKVFGSKERSWNATGAKRAHTAKRSSSAHSLPDLNDLEGDRPFSGSPARSPGGLFDTPGEVGPGNTPVPPTAVSFGPGRAPVQPTTSSCRPR